MTEVNLIVAFAAGVLGFLSPCIVPLIPGYISFVSGVSLQEMDTEERRRQMGRVLPAMGLFVVGFALVFSALGASASVLGGVLLQNRRLLARIGGVVVIALGAAVLLRLPALMRERRLHLARRPGGLFGAVPVGMAFAFAWTPCVGPVLAAVLTLAASSQGAGRGALLLFAYALGLGVPFLVSAVVVVTAVGSLAWLRRHSAAITTVSGVFLVVMGVAMVTDVLFVLNTWIFRVLPFRPAL